MSPSLIEQILSSMDVQVKAFAVCRIGPDSALVVPPVSELQIIHVLTGTLHLMVEGSQTLVQPAGSTAIIPKNRSRTLAGANPPVHRFDVKATANPDHHGLSFVDAFNGPVAENRVLCGRIQVKFAGDYQGFDALNHPIGATFANRGFTRTLFETMLDEWRSRSFGSRTLANTLMKACLVDLLRHCLDRSEPTSAAPAILSEPWLVRVITMIMGKLSAVHSVASLARYAGMSRSGFAKAFEATIGLTPMDYVARVRLARAREMLAVVDDPIASIAESVGFSSRSHFSLRFRDCYGEGPNDYRQRIRQQTADDAPALACDRRIPDANGRPDPTHRV